MAIPRLNLEYNSQVHIEQARISPQKVPEVPLVSFELNFESLKDFLNNMSVVISQHATLLSKIQDQVTEKLPIQGMVESDMQAGQKINLTLGLHPDEPRNPNLTQASQYKVNSLGSICSQLQSLNKFKSICEERLSKIESNVEKKLDKNQFRIKHKKLKDKIRNEMTEQKQYLENKIQNLEIYFEQKIRETEKKMQDLEMHTY